MRVAEDGTSNLDLFPEEEGEAEAAPYAVDLDDVQITDLSLRYADRATDVDLILDDLDAALAGTVTDAGTDLAIAASVDSLSALAGGIGWLRDTRWTADVGLAYDDATGTVRFLENTVTVNALTVSFDGTVTPQGDDTALAIALVAPDAAFPALLSLVPDAYTEDFEGIDADGTMTLAGTVEGVLPAEGDDLPGFDLELTVKDGRFRYPDLPVGVDRVGLDVRIRHPQGPADLTEIDVQRFALACAGSELTGSGSIAHPLTDPVVALSAKGAVDLEKLGRAFPGSTGESTGRVGMDLTVRGRASDFQAGAVDRVEARGRLEATNVRYSDPELGPSLQVDALDLALAGPRARLDRLDVGWAVGSDLSVTGTFEQFLPYFLADDGALVGRLDLAGQRVDLRPWAAGDADAPADADAGEGAGLVVPVPSNLDLTCDLAFDTLITDVFEMRDVTGMMFVEDQAVRLRRLRGSMLGGSVELGGSYAASTYDDAAIDLQIRTAEFDLARTVAHFETLRRIAPILEGAVGRFDSNFSLSTRILADGTPMFATLASEGLLRTAGLVLKPAPLQGVAQKVGQRGAAELELKGSELGFRIREGMLRLEPFDARLFGRPTTIGGTASLVSERLDLTLDTALPSGPIRAASGGAALLEPLGERLPELVDVQIRITGSYAEPKVGLALAGMGAGAVAEGAVDALREAGEQVLGGALDEARRKGDALVAEANRRAEALRAEGAASAARIRAEGAARGDKLIEEARGNPVQMAVAQEAAKTAEREADRAATRVEREANAAAAKLVAEARAQRDRLIEEAAGSP